MGSVAVGASRISFGASTSLAFLQSSARPAHARLLRTLRYECAPRARDASLVLAPVPANTPLADPADAEPVDVVSGRLHSQHGYQNQAKTKTRIRAAAERVRAARGHVAFAIAEPEQAAASATTIARARPSRRAGARRPSGARASPSRNHNTRGGERPARTPSRGASRARVRSRAVRPGPLAGRGRKAGGEGDEPPERLFDKPAHRCAQGATCAGARRAAVGPAAAVSAALTARGYRRASRRPQSRPPSSHPRIFAVVPPAGDEHGDEDESGSADAQDVPLTRSPLVRGRPHIFEAMNNAGGGLGLGIGLDIDGREDFAGAAARAEGRDDDDNERAYESTCGYRRRSLSRTRRPRASTARTGRRRRPCGSPRTTGARAPGAESMPVRQYAYHATGDDDALKAELARACGAYTRAILQLVRRQRRRRAAPRGHPPILPAHSLRSARVVVRIVVPPWRTPSGTRGAGAGAGFRSLLFRMRRGPLLQVFVPSLEGR